MKNKSFIVLGLLLLAGVQAKYYYGKMPETMASHWDGSGNPNGWSTPAQFFAVILLVEVLCVGWLAFLPLLSRLPKAYFNLPNKDYWLAPERKSDTLEWMQSAFANFGIATQLLLLYTVQLAVQANLSRPPTLSGNIVYALVAYLAYTIYWSVVFLRKFYKTPVI